MGSNLPEGKAGWGGGGAPLYKSKGTLHASRKIKIKPLRETNVSHAKWDQNLQFTSLSETPSIPVTLIWESYGSPGSLSPHGVQSNIARVKKKSETEKNKQTKTS